MRLIDTNGTKVAEYTYDPFGKILSASGSMAEINPIRYRGYCYDTETGFYYLQSRYYDPTICRFINADSYASTGQSFIGYNMFAYCANNPVLFFDIEGERPVGIGFQVELSAGGTSIGIEIVIYFDEKVCDGKGIVVVCYNYSGADLSAENLLMLQDYVSTISVIAEVEIGDLETDMLLTVAESIMNGAGLSGAAFVIDGNENFTSPKSYSGEFQTLSFSGYSGIKKISTYFSYCGTCRAFGVKVGVSTDNSHFLPFDIGYSHTVYSDPIELLRLVKQ